MSVHAAFLKPRFLLVKNYSFRDARDNSGYFPLMTLGQKIRARREEMNLSQADLGKRIGISQVSIDKIESGKTLKSKYLPEVLSILGMPLDLISATVGRGAAPAQSTVSAVDLGELVPVKIAGKAKAGEFISIEDLGDWEEPEEFLDTRDPRFPHARHLGFEVEGDSMNALKPRPIQDGDRLSALAYEDIADRFPLRDGMIVVVQRTRHGGHEREWSVKQLEIYEDRMEFHPRSTNPRHKPIIIKRDSLADDGVTVEIIAIVRRLVAEFNL
ncbi:XRE family transcriptional regulator [Bosea sp. AK1]|uniref:XRE family transcriptional regulator n=1 Tax=Bosea sp. AK1 TaxID=2587160 RepID=UPI0020C17104|nr:XRE family transcriptional regulator [Bosea sp. AK1]